MAEATEQPDSAALALVDRIIVRLGLPVTADTRTQVLGVLVGFTLAEFLEPGSAAQFLQVEDR